VRHASLRSRRRRPDAIRAPHDSPHTDQAADAARPAWRATALVLNY